MHVNIIQRLVTTKEIFSHRLTMIFQKDFHSFSMIFSRYLKMLKQHGPQDDKLDSENLTQIADEQQKLAQGITTPDEFIETCDSFVKSK